MNAVSEVVLVVEDEPQLASILTRSLQRQGYTVLTAADGKEGLAVAQSHGAPIDLLISDIVMPGMGGRELVWRIREIYPDIKVILCSGYADMEGAFQLMEDEAQITFVEKPVDLQELGRIVREILDE